MTAPGHSFNARTEPDIPLSHCWYIVVERPLEGVNAPLQVRAIMESAAELDTLARAIGTKPLTRFFSVDLDELEEFLEEAEEAKHEIPLDHADLFAISGGDADALSVEQPEEEPSGEELPPEHWYPASEGLATVRHLQRFLRLHPGELTGGDALEVILELEAMGVLLEVAQREEVRWHCNWM